MFEFCLVVVVFDFFGAKNIICHDMLPFLLQYYFI